MRVARIAPLVVVAALVVAFAGVGRPESAGSAGSSGGRTITVSGSGSVTVVPNRASFSFGVTTQGRTAAAALAENATEMRKVIAALKDAGIAPADIQSAALLERRRVDPRLHRLELGLRDGEGHQQGGLDRGRGRCRRRESGLRAVADPQ